MATRDTPNWLTLSLAPLGSGSAASVMGAVLGQHAGLEPYEVIALIASVVMLSGITAVAVAKVTARSGDIRESSKAAVRASAVKGDIPAEMAAILLNDGGISPTADTPSAHQDGSGRFKLPWRR
jgi:hypothetical protein